MALSFILFGSTILFGGIGGLLEAKGFFLISNRKPKVKETSS
jgi:hypothetical protein